MLQQMQRQMRGGGGGGMQEMMKAMMQSQGGDQSDMDELQRAYSTIQLRPIKAKADPSGGRHDVADGRRDGRTPRHGGWHAEYGGHDEDDGRDGRDGWVGWWPVICTLTGPADDFAVLPPYYTLASCIEYRRLYV